MDHKTVEKLEIEIGEAIAGVFEKLGRKKRPSVPNDQIMHLMAKAAVTVYEAAVETRDRSD